LPLGSRTKEYAPLADPDAFLALATPDAKLRWVVRVDYLWKTYALLADADVFLVLADRAHRYGRVRCVKK